MSRSVILVEDHALVGQVLERALGYHDYRVEVVSGPTVDDIVERVVSTMPDVVIVDLEVGLLGGSVELVRRLVELGGRVLVLSGTLDLSMLGACLDAGVHAAVTKGESLDVLLEKLERAATGEDAIGPGRRAALIDAWRVRASADAARLEPFHRLTSSEQAVLAALLDGVSLQAIAAARFVSIATVRSQVRGILQKLGVNSQLAAVAAARRAGWHAPCAV